MFLFCHLLLSLFIDSSPDVAAILGIAYCQCDVTVIKSCIFHKLSMCSINKIFSFHATYKCQQHYCSLLFTNRMTPLAASWFRILAKKVYENILPTFMNAAHLDVLYIWHTAFHQVYRRIIQTLSLSPELCKNLLPIPNVVPCTVWTAGHSANLSPYIVHSFVPITHFWFVQLMFNHWQ